MLRQFQGLIARVEAMDSTTLTIKAEGTYPVAARTPVQAVAHYQNDGTEKIKPSRFVERAERTNRKWFRDIVIAIDRFIDSDDDKAFDVLGLKIAKDIMDKVDRIRTGRLKASMVHEWIR